MSTALGARTSAVLVAPPGAGKTTRVPLALMDESWLRGRKTMYPYVTVQSTCILYIMGFWAVGGLLTQTQGVPTPEVYSATNGWRQLTGISIDPNEWYYPRGFFGPDGAVYVRDWTGPIRPRVARRCSSRTKSLSLRTTSNALIS